MDKRVRLCLYTRIVAALASLLPRDRHDHPDAQVLFDGNAQPAVDEITLMPLVDALGLSAVEHAAFALALWGELDEKIAAALALLQASAARTGSSLPTVGLVANLAGQLDLDAESVNRPAKAMGQLLQGPAVASGLLQLVDSQLPVHARSLQVQPALVALLAYDVTPRSDILLGRLRLAALASPAWPLPQAWREAAQRIASTASDASGSSVVVLRGADHEELSALAFDIARRLGRSAFEIQAADDSASTIGDTLASRSAREGVAPALIAARGLPVWHADLVPGVTQRIPKLAYWGAPLIVLAGADSSFETSLPLQEFDLLAPDADDRLRIWTAIQAVEVSTMAPADRKAVAMSRCGTSVLAQAAARTEVDIHAHAAIEHAVRSSARSLSAWAQVSTDCIPAHAWVGPPDVQRDLDLLLTRCRARAELSAHLGPLLHGRLGDGVKALFIGASGTGKTLAAQWLADRLARPLVRVDLAAVVSKYIGETEKNLARLLARVEHLDAVLLFDEADSLFGARTDVKQANDRYANMQTNYLLQRLETFHGVAVLTSNSKARFDDAFLRRLDVIVEFPLPDVAERRELWSLHLGGAHALDANFLNAVTAMVDLPGGHIRNAVVTAALLARQRQRDTGEESDELPLMRAADLREALALEYRKLGQRIPDSLSG